jgi:hypothetical protein
MKFYLLILSIIIPVLGSTQEVTFKYGPPITKETVSNLSYKFWFDTEKGAYAMSRSLMNSPEFFCHLDSYYFILKKGVDEKMALLIFNEQYNLVHAIMVETCESLEKSNFLGIAEFNGSVSLFFEAPSESGNKEKKGVYLSTLNTKTLKLNEPVLVSEFQSSGKIKNFEARVSKNKSYLSLLANPDTKALEYSYSFSVLDKTLNKIQAESFVSGKLEDTHKYRSSYISDLGVFGVLFDEKGQSPTGSAMETCTQDPHDYFTCVTHEAGGTKNENFVKLEGRTLLNMSFVEVQDLKLFVSWYDSEEESKAGFSIYEPITKKEEFKYTFDASYFEPFIKRKVTWVLDDRIEKVSDANLKIVNVFFDILEIIETEESITYILKKSTRLVVSAGTSSGQANIIQNHGDFLIVKQDLNTNEISTAKIERVAFPSMTKKYEVISKQNEKIHFLYYSLIPEEERTGPSALEAGQQNLALYSSVVDLASLEVETLKIAGYAKDNSFKYILHLGSIFQSANKFVALSISEENQRMISGSFEQ